MASLLVIDVLGAKPSLKGRLQRIMLEIRPGSFVGKLPSKAAKSIWDAICKDSKAAIAVFAAKTEIGFVIATHGENRRKPIDNYGIQLVTYTKNKKD